MTICRGPHYIIIHLKRFTDTGHKIHRKVNITPILEICTKEYWLSSVVMHKGATEHTGHYMTLFQERTNQWILFDDDRIKIDIRQKEVHWMLQHWAYICLYRSMRKQKGQEPKAPNNNKKQKEEELDGEEKEELEEERGQINGDGVHGQQQEPPLGSVYYGQSNHSVVPN